MFARIAINRIADNWFFNLLFIEYCLTDILLILPREQKCDKKIKTFEYYFILCFYTHKGEKLWQHTKRWQQHPLSSVHYSFTFFFLFCLFQLGSTAFTIHAKYLFLFFFLLFFLYTHKHSQ